MAAGDAERAFNRAAGFPVFNFTYTCRRGYTVQVIDGVDTHHETWVKKVDENGYETDEVEVVACSCEE